MTRFGGESEPEGLPLPIVSVATIQQMIKSRHELDEGESLDNQEAATITRENRMLGAWLTKLAASYEDTSHKMISMIAGLTCYRLLRVQAESDALAPKDDSGVNLDALGQIRLPRVLGEKEGEDMPWVVLPLDQAKEEIHIDRVLARLESDTESMLHRYIVTLYEEEDAKLRVVRAAACGICYLLMYYSEERD